MRERRLEPGFERDVADALWAYSGEVLQPFDAVEIAHRAATGGRRAASSGSFFGRLVPAPVMWLLLSALLLLAVTATAFAAGWVRLPEPVVQPSPTTAMTPDPTRPADPSPPPATPALPSDSPATPAPPPTDAGPTVAPPTPTPSPSPSPTLEPSPSATPDLPDLGEWRLLDGFPAGDEPFVRVTGVTVGGPGFVAVGWTGDGAGGTEGARAWTSADGQGWQVASSESFGGARLEFVAALGEELFAFGPIPTDDPDFPLVGAYNVWRSADGIAWEQLPQPAPFADSAVLLGVLSTDSGLIAYGQRDMPAAGSEPGVWTSADGIDWQQAETLPDTHDVLGMAQSDGLLVALGNSRSDEPPWRTLDYSTDGGRNWQPASAPGTDDALVSVEAVAGRPGALVAVGWRGQRDDVSAFALRSGTGSAWEGGPLTGSPMHQLERVVSVPGGFLALGSELRFEVDNNCAPGPCEEHVPIGGRSWLSEDGLDWQPGPPLPSPIVWLFAGVAAGNNGVVVTGFDAEFNRGVWFAPLTSPLP